MILVRENGTGEACSEKYTKEGRPDSNTISTSAHVYIAEKARKRKDAVEARIARSKGRQSQCMHILFRKHDECREQM